MGEVPFGTRRVACLRWTTLELDGVDTVFLLTGRHVETCSGNCRFCPIQPLFRGSLGVGVPA